MLLSIFYKSFWICFQHFIRISKHATCRSKICLLFKVSKVLAVFSDLYGFEPSAICGFFADESIKDIKQMRCQTFGGTIFENVGLEKMRERRKHFESFRIGFRKHERMVQMFGNPLIDKLNAPEIDDKAEMIKLFAGKGQRQRPIMPVNKRAMPRMTVLNMSYWDVGINFLAGVHS